MDSARPDGRTTIREAPAAGCATAETCTVQDHWHRQDPQPRRSSGTGSRGAAWVIKGEHERLAASCDLLGMGARRRQRSSFCRSTPRWAVSLQRSRIPRTHRAEPRSETSRRPRPKKVAKGKSARTAHRRRNDPRQEARAQIPMAAHLHRPTAASSPAATPSVLRTQRRQRAIDAAKPPIPRASSSSIKRSKRARAVRAPVHAPPNAARASARARRPHP